MSDKSKNAAGSADSTKEELLSLNKILSNENSRLESVIESLQKINSELVEANNGLTASLEASEGVITEQITQLEIANKQVLTGDVIVTDDEGNQYKVIGKKIPTGALAVELECKCVASVDLHKFPRLIQFLLNIGSGFLKPLIDKF